MNSEHPFDPTSPPIDCLRKLYQAWKLGRFATLESAAHLFQVLSWLADYVAWQQDEDRPGPVFGVSEEQVQFAREAADLVMHLTGEPITAEGFGDRIFARILQSLLAQFLLRMDDRMLWIEKFLKNVFDAIG